MHDRSDTFFASRKPPALLPEASFAHISCIYAYALLRISFFFLRLVFRNVLFYESPAEYQPLRSFF